MALAATGTTVTLPVTLSASGSSESESGESMAPVASVTDSGVSPGRLTGEVTVRYLQLEVELKREAWSLNACEAAPPPATRSTTTLVVLLEVEVSDATGGDATCTCSDATGSSASGTYAMLPVQGAATLPVRRNLNRRQPAGPGRSPDPGPQVESCQCQCQCRRWPGRPRAAPVARARRGPAGHRRLGLVVSSTTLRHALIYSKYALTHATVTVCQCI